jgi:sulfhydrogenase subunit alpha
MHVRIKAGKVEDLSFRIFEPPRFFEALLRGRPYTDAPDITSRICGICPIAYILGASLAMEDALGVGVDGPIRALRRLIYCGEWVQSHVLHTNLLHAPDFLGYADSFEMAKDHPGVVESALAVKKVGGLDIDAAASSDDPCILVRDALPEVHDRTRLKAGARAV